jgi:hypothetical protein
VPTDRQPQAYVGRHGGETSFMACCLGRGVGLEKGKRLS